MAVPGSPNEATTESTWATNASCDANGSAPQIRSSTEQPSERSALSTPESTAGSGGPNWMCSSGDQPFGHASSTIGITSDADPPSASPPPETVGAFVTEAGAVFAVRTVTLIGGYEAPGARASDRVHVVVTHVQPGPAAATGPAPALKSLISAVSPAGSGSATVTTPDVGSAPALRTVSGNVPRLNVVFGPATRRNDV